MLQSRMGSHYRNHHALLQYRVAQQGSSPMFKIPIITGPEPPTQWTDVSLSQFATEVEHMAHLLATLLEEKGVPLRSTVAVWSSGKHYAQFIHIIALSRASYIPQMFSDSLTDTGIIFELMSKGNGRAIVYDPSLEPLMGNCPYAMLPMCSISDGPKGSEPRAKLPKVEDLPTDEAICFIFHTSGSTSGSPKLVPFTHKFISTIFSEIRSVWCQGGPFDTQDVFVQLGSICHAATMIEYLGLLDVGGCIVQPSSFRFSTAELSSMVKNGGVNRLSLFTPPLFAHLKAAQKDVEVLKMFQGLRTVTYGGSSPPPEVEDWGYKNNIPLTNIYASTECGFLMTSTLGKHPSLMKPLQSVSYRFELVGETTQIDSTNSKLLHEFVVLPDSPNIPQPHLLSPDGTFRTGDFFEEVEDGYYICRGRDDDWIKSDMTKRCDTKAIEDNVRATCGDIIKDCVVVGNDRPSPALFIEKPSASSDAVSEESLKDSILSRMKQFNNRRYDHERITDHRLIFVVPENTLPRTTKGNIRRKAIEQLYLKQLDSVYALIRA